MSVAIHHCTESKLKFTFSNKVTCIVFIDMNVVD